MQSLADNLAGSQKILVCAEVHSAGNLHKKKLTEIDNAATQIPAGTASIAIDFFCGFVFMFISLKYLIAAL